MSIIYSGNAQAFTITTGPSTPSSDYEAGFVSGMVTAGWTNTLINASDVLTFTSNPANASTVTLDSSTNAVTYTFVSSFSNTAFNVLIGDSLSASISNLVACITGGAGGGSLYGNGTGYHAHNTITAVGTSTTLTASYITGGSAGNGAAASTTGTLNGTWATSTLLGGGNNLLSAITPQGLQASCLVYTTSGSFYNPGTALNVIAGDRSRARTSPNLCGGSSAQVVGSSTSFKVIANKYQFLSFQLGTANSTYAMNGVGVFVPAIPSSLQAPTITAATNASPIQCTIASHGYSNGQTVFIVGGTGNTAVNGTWTITVVDSNNFTLGGSTGNGTYTGNAICANTTIGQTIAEAIFTSGTSGAGPVTLRQGVNPNGGEVWQCVNTLTGSNAAAGSAPVVFWPNNAIQWYDNSYFMYEPFVGWAPSGSGSQKIIGQMWDMVAIHNNSITLDQTATFDSPSHNFWTICVDGGTSAASLLLATS